MMKRLWIVLCMAALAVGVGACNKGDEKSGAAKPLNIAVIPKGTTHEFWKSIEAGARQAGKDLGVQIQWKGPVLENDRAEQIKIVEQFSSEGISGIVLAPLDDVALVRPVQEAMNNKVSVVICDSALKGEAGKDFVSFVATDNKAGGVLAGERLAKLMGGKGKVVMMRYDQGSASTMDREAGFLEVMGKNPEITVTVSNRFGGPTTDSAKTAALELLDKIKEADGIFASNESNTFGVLLALRAGRADEEGEVCGV